MTNDAERDDMLAIIMKLTSGLARALDLPREIAETILKHLPGYVMFPGIHTVHRLTVDIGTVAHATFATVATGPVRVRGNLPLKYNVRMLQ